MQAWVATYGKVDPSARISALEDIQIAAPSEPEKLDTPPTDKSTVEAPAEDAPKPEEAPAEDAPKPEEAAAEDPDALIVTKDNVTPENLMEFFAGTTGPTKLLPGTTGPTKDFDSEAWLRDLRKQIDTLGSPDWKAATVDTVVTPVAEDPVDAWRKRGIERN